jgi:hypothetical protein
VLRLSHHLHIRIFAEFRHHLRITGSSAWGMSSDGVHRFRKRIGTECRHHLRTIAGPAFSGGTHDQRV